MEMEDEVHFILKCPFYDDLKKPIFQLANLQYPIFMELTDLEQLNFQSEDFSPAQKGGFWAEPFFHILRIFFSIDSGSQEYPFQESA